MSVFDRYARYYDLLYRDKDYSAEARYVHSLIQKHAHTPESILELGCGTGSHARFLAELGYELCGVDASTEMIERARVNLLATAPLELGKLSFSVGDIRNVRLNTRFNAVIALFHVMSYQVTNTDLSTAFATAKAHLKEGGVFIFDCWYGPAVLTERPSIRLKRVEDEALSITRIAEPVMHPNENLVDVNYRILITDKANGRVEEVQETHRMRYLFTPEIASLLSQNGFTIAESAEWLSGKEPGFDTWNVYFVARSRH